MLPKKMDVDLTPKIREELEALIDKAQRELEAILCAPDDWSERVGSTLETLVVGVLETVEQRARGVEIKAMALRLAERLTLGSTRTLRVGPRLPNEPDFTHLALTVTTKE